VHRNRDVLPLSTPPPVAASGAGPQPRAPSCRIEGSLEQRSDKRIRATHAYSGGWGSDGLASERYVSRRIKRKSHPVSPAANHGDRVARSSRARTTVVQRYAAGGIAWKTTGTDLRHRGREDALPHGGIEGRDERTTCSRPQIMAWRHCILAVPQGQSPQMARQFEASSVQALGAFCY
jgi:hypothetical protein